MTQTPRPASKDSRQAEISFERPRIVAAICTFHRNDALRRLLDRLIVCAQRCASRAAVGVVIVDDTAEGLARDVVESYRDSFEVACIYLISGRGNISMARNLALEAALPIADWVAMTDDDCEPAEDWLNAFLDVQSMSGATAVTGPMIRRFAEGSSAWLSKQPFALLGVDEEENGTEVTTGSTNNSLISASWLKAHPIRFDPELGRIGGEDMVFYRTARAAGLKIHFSREAVVFEDLPLERSTYGYQLRRFFWQGNSAFVTCIRTGKSRTRMLVHGVASMARAALRPISRAMRREPLELRYTLALIAEAAGKISGFFGWRVNHH